MLNNDEKQSGCDADGIRCLVSLHASLLLSKSFKDVDVWLSLKFIKYIFYQSITNGLTYGTVGP